MGLKRRGTARKQVLDLSDKSDSPRQSWQTKYQQICEEHNSQNGDSPESGMSVLPVATNVPSNNPLSGLIANYNSDSDADDGGDEATDDMNSKVSDFMKEIQTIVPSGSSIVVPGQPLTTPGLGPEDLINQPPLAATTAGSGWQECYDETTGYMYYWHVTTNEVTWETPADYPSPPAPVPPQPVPTLTSAHHWPEVTYPATLQAPAPQSDARNKSGRKVLTKSTYPVINKSAKGRPTSDSEDERIEMITSFGQSSDESEEETPPPPKKKRLVVSSGGHELIGPQLQDPDLRSPPSAVGPDRMPLGSPTSPVGEDIGPPGVDPEEVTEREMIVTKVPSDHCSLPSTPAESEDSESGETDEGVILSRLRSQALLLQQLGGDVPDEIRHLIEPEPEAQPEAEPEAEPEPQVEEAVDAAIDFDKELEQMERELLEITEARKTAASVASEAVEAEAVKGAEETETPGTKKPTSFALIAGYGDDSEPEEDSPVLTPVVKRTFQSLPTIPVKALFPIFQEAAVTSTAAGIDDTAVMTILDGRSEAASEDVPPPPPDLPMAASGKKTDFTIAALRSREPTPDPDPDKMPTVQPMIDTSMPTKAGKRRKRLDISTSAELVARATRESVVAMAIQDGNVLEEGTKEEAEKAEAVRDEESEEKPSIEDKKAADALKREEAEARKNVEELADLIMEKVEFLREGKDPVSPVQVMAIQIETLVSAWHKGALAQAYLSKWLGVTWEELRRLETVAAPHGWTCQWDRAHKRYYYHNIATDQTRWEYPEEETRPLSPAAAEKKPCERERESGGIAGGELAMEICTTPPPPPLPVTPPRLPTPPTPPPPPPPQPKTPPPPVITVPEPTPPPPPRISPFPPARNIGKKGKGKRKYRMVDSSVTTSKTVPTSPPLPPLPPPPANPPPPPPELPPLPPTPPLPAPSSRLAYGEPLPPGVDAVDLPYLPAYEPPPPEEPAEGQMMGMMHPMQAYMMPTYQPPMVATSSIGAPMMDYGYMMHTHMPVPAVIAKPPAKKHKAALHAALDSFYSDLATMEPQEEVAVEEAEEVVAVQQKVEVAEVVAAKKKKPKKMSAGLGMKKKKGVSSLVAKWQQVQQEVRRDYKTLDQHDPDS